MNNKRNRVSVKLEPEATEFFKKLRLNIIRAGGSEEAITISYAELMAWIVKYFKFDNMSYTNMVGEIAKNV